MAPSDRDPRGTAEDTRQDAEDRDDEALALVRAAASRLYAGAPADFIATRSALVKEAKAAGAKDAAKEIGALRKPSVAAWFINQVAHAQHQVIAELTDLGARLRQATSTLDAAAITGMRSERDTVLADLVRAVRQVADGHEESISASVEAEVRDTGIAALADEAAEEVLRSGTMTRALAYAGFGEVDLSQAAATTSTGVVLTSIPGGRKKSDKAEHARRASEPAEDETSDVVEEDDAEIVAEALDHGEEPDEESDVEAAALDHGEESDEESDADSDDAEADTDDQPDPDDDADDVDDGAEALAEAAAEEERERRLLQAEQAVDSASREIGRRRAALDAARNRSEATRQRIQKLETQLERARADDDDALDKVGQAVAATKRADAALKAARAALADLGEQ